VSGLLLALAIWLAVAVAYRGFALHSLARLCDAPAEPDAAAPPGEIVAVRPLHGAPPALVSCLESLLRAGGREGARIVLGTERPDDPAVAPARAVLARFPEARAELRTGPAPGGLNRKAANLVQITEGLKADVWLLTDADVRVPADYVARVTRALADPEVGLVTGPYRSVPARGLASRVDALLTNTHFIPSTCVAARTEGVHFGLGASIAVRGEALSRIGGFRALVPLAADDYWLARKVEAAGWRLAWAPVLVDHVLEDEGWRRALHRQLRWARAVRSSRPVGYFGQLAILGPVPALLLGAAWLAAGGPGGLVPVFWWALQGVLTWRQRALLGLRPSDLALLPLTDLVAVGVWVGGLFGSAEPPDGGDPRRA
jgi:ceramide glucosyltransferase